MPLLFLTISNAIFSRIIFYFLTNLKTRFTLLLNACCGTILVLKILLVLFCGSFFLAPACPGLRNGLLYQHRRLQPVSLSFLAAAARNHAKGPKRDGLRHSGVSLFLGLAALKFGLSALRRQEHDPAEADEVGNEDAKHRRHESQVDEHRKR